MDNAISAEACSFRRAGLVAVAGYPVRSTDMQRSEKSLSKLNAEAGIARFESIKESLILCRTPRGQKYGTNHAMAAGGYSTHHPEALAQHPQRNQDSTPPADRHQKNSARS
ncbi:hypothetical protein MCOR02_011452 [Pyricularia oryzae]|uniref:Uncharacterized protein n=1 Tax=Pyricularia oryzae TaxID=318829 RepID=A0A4P7N6Y8_PYROR|nr:hypothetical protein MCOR02_011452 [Pyricularia oryzae]QBZ58199.1 hypothetical protein PoMZ_03144 [Pyricularia oryzae]